MDNMSDRSEGSFAIKRRPVGGSGRKPVQQALLSPTAPPEVSYSSQLLGLVDGESSLSPATTQSSGSCFSEEETTKNGHNSSTTNGDIPSPPPTASPTLSLASQEPSVRDVYFSTPPGTDQLPTPPPSAQASRQYYSPQPPPPTSQAAVVPAFDPPNAFQPLYPVYGATQTSSPPTTVPGESQFRGAPFTSGGTPLSPISSNTRRLSTWSKEAVDKYWNKETAKKAYANSMEFLVKTNDKLGKIIDPLMPVVGLTNPDLAAAYQVTRLVNQNQAALNNGVTTPNQNPNGFNNLVPLLGVLAQAAVNTSDSTTADTNPFSLATSPFSSSVDQSACISALLQNSTADPSAYLAALAQNGGADTNAALFGSLIQQQSSAATTSLLASMAAQGNAPPNAFAQILAAAQSGQDSSMNLMNSLIAQEQATQVTALANLAAFDPQSQNFQANTDLNATRSFVPNSETSGVFADSEQSTENKNSQPADTQRSNGPRGFVPRPQSTTVPNPLDRDAWVHQRVSMFGFENLSFPPNSELSSQGHNILVGNLVAISGQFQIKLLYTSAHVLQEIAAVQALKSDEEMSILKPCSIVDFGISCGGISMDCSLYINEPDEDGVVPAMYKAIVQSPYGHGLAFSYFVPADQLQIGSRIAASMISSIEWLDRGTISNPVSFRVLGKWRHEVETFLIDLGDECTSEVMDLTFADDGRYQYDRSQGSLENSAHDRSSGQFEVYEYKDNVIHLVLTHDDSGGIEVQDLQLAETFICIKGKKYFKLLEEPVFVL